jgi:hypothetical protein
MAIDVATLGIAVDSSQAVRASGDLDKLTASANRATKAAGDLGKENNVVSLGAARMQRELQASTDALTKVADASTLVGRAIGFLGGPAGIAAMAITTVTSALHELYRQSSSGPNQLEQSLKEHARLVKLIKDAYDSATESALALNRVRLNNDLFQAGKNIEDLQRQLNDKINSMLGGVTTTGAYFGGPRSEIIETTINGLKELDPAFRVLRETMKQGQVDLDAYRAALRDIAVQYEQTNPEIAKQALELSKSSNEWIELKIKIDEAVASMQRAQGIAGNAGDATAPGRLFQEARDALIKMAPEENEAIIRQEKLAEALRRRNQMLAAAAQLEYGGAKAVAEANKLYANAEAAINKKTEAEKASFNAYDNAKQRTQDQIDVLREQAQSYGKLNEEVDRLAKTRELERAAAKADKEIGEKERAEIDKLAESYAKVREEIRNANEARRTIESFGSALVGALEGGANAGDRLVSSLSGIGKQLATQSINRLLTQGTVFGNQSLNSVQGAAGMLGAAAMGYQVGVSSGSRATGALMGAASGALAGATFGPWGAVAGGVIGGVSGLIGGGQGAEQAKQQGYQDNINYALAARARVIAAEQDVSTRAGQIAAFESRLAQERTQAAAHGTGRVAQIERAHAAERAKLARDMAEQDLERQKAYRDRLFLAVTDLTTVDGALAAFDRAAQQQRELEAKNGNAGIADLEAALAAERLNIIEDFNERAIEDSRRAAEQMAQIVASITEYRLGLLTSADSPLSPGERLNSAQQAYNATLALAQGGNVDALSRITRDAEAYRQAGQAQFGSSSGYQAIFQQIQDQLGSLPDVQAATDPVVVALNSVVNAVNATTQAAQDTASAVNDNTQVLTSQILAAVNAGNATATAAALNGSFAALDSNIDGLLTFGELVSGLTPLARDASVTSTNTVLNQAVVPSLGNINTRAYETVGAINSNVVPGLSSIFAELDGNGNGVLERSELIRAAAATTAANVNNVDDAIDGSGGSNDILDQIRLLNDLLTRQLATIAVPLTPGSETRTPNWQNTGNDGPTNVGIPGWWRHPDTVTTTPGYTVDTVIPAGGVNNTMLQALNKIVINTAHTAHNTAVLLTGNTAIAGNRRYGVYADGGVIPPGGLGLVSEHSPGGGRFIRAGAEPITVTPHEPANDNRALINEVRELRKEVAALRMQNREWQQAENRPLRQAGRGR